jgi:hypothetical protein
MKLHPERHDRRARAGGIHWALLLVFALLALATLRPATAEPPIRFEAQVGQCEHGRAADGVWWSSYYVHQFDLRSTCWQLSASRAVGTWRGNHYGWRLGYVDLGRIKARANFTYIEPQYPGENGAGCKFASTKDPAGCLGTGHMRQHTRGLTVGGFAERPVAGWTLGIEGGAYFYYSRFESTVVSIPDASQIPAYTHVYGDWLATPYVGLTARRGIFFATGRVYSIIEAHEHGNNVHGTDCFGCSGMTDNHAWQITAGVQIPFK